MTDASLAHDLLAPATPKTKAPKGGALKHQLTAGSITGAETASAEKTSLNGAGGKKGISQKGVVAHEPNASNENAFKAALSAETGGDNSVVSEGVKPSTLTRKTATGATNAASDDPLSTPGLSDASQQTTTPTLHLVRTPPAAEQGTDTGVDPSSGKSAKAGETTALIPTKTVQRDAGEKISKGTPSAKDRPDAIQGDHATTASDDILVALAASEAPAGSVPVIETASVNNGAKSNKPDQSPSSKPATTPSIEDAPGQRKAFSASPQSKKGNEPSQPDDKSAKGKAAGPTSLASKSSAVAETGDAKPGRRHISSENGSSTQPSAQRTETPVQDAKTENKDGAIPNPVLTGTDATDLPSVEVTADQAGPAPSSNNQGTKTEVTAAPTPSAPQQIDGSSDTKPFRIAQGPAELRQDGVPHSPPKAEQSLSNDGETLPNETVNAARANTAAAAKTTPSPNGPSLEQMVESADHAEAFDPLIGSTSIAAKTAQKSASKANAAKEAEKSVTGTKATDRAQPGSSQNQGTVNGPKEVAASTPTSSNPQGPDLRFNPTPTTEAGLRTMPQVTVDPAIDPAAPSQSSATSGEIQGAQNRAAGTSNLSGPNSASTVQAQTLSQDLAVHMARNLRAGTNRFDIRLDPPELGRIDIRMEINREGQVQATLLVERTDALDILRGDARLLERALHDAGLKTDSQSLTFSLSDQETGQGGAGHQDRLSDLALDHDTDDPEPENSTRSLDAEADVSSESTEDWYGLRVSARAGIDVHI